MSLFKIREFWSTHSENDEYFDQNSLITTILNSGSDFIITGSHSGVLRIFKPSCELSEDNNIQGFKASDLLIEKICNSPILQLGCGRFVSASQNLHLAVLHPRQLSVYTLKTKEGITDHGTQNCLDRIYEHNLRKSAANFVIGPFGGTQNRDFICVQSLDGMLSFFEQENFTFSSFLPEFLLPGPIHYLKKSDSFVVASSSWSIVSYRYKTLCEAGENKESEITVHIDNEWIYNLGEPVMDISVIDDYTNKEAWITILGERNLYCLSSSGKLKFMKRLEYLPMCFNTYVIEDDIFSLVISETSTLLIYQNTTLKWSSHLQFVPVAIKRAFLERVKGALVLLSEEGRLELCYLGTEPSPFIAPPLATKNVDFEKGEEELSSLNKIIKQAYGNDMKISKADVNKELIVNVSVNSELEPCTYKSKLKDIEDPQMSSITVDIEPQIIFEEVQVSLVARWPLKITPEVQFFTNLTEKTSFTSHVYIDEAAEYPSLDIEVITTVISNLGIPKIVRISTTLPMKLVLQCCKPQKEGEHKVTLNINQSPAPLALLFPEYVNEDLLSQANNAVAFTNVTGSGKPVTILLAKSSQRYRIQSDSFASLSPLIELMIFRLRKHHGDKNDFKVSFGSSPPTNELILYISNHFRARQQVIKSQDRLAQLSSQYRAIEKRLVAKFRAKNPTPLTNLNLLLEETHSEIMNTTNQLEEENRELLKCQTELSCALNIVRNLISLMDLDKNLKETLESVFCASVDDCESQGWEDVMDTSLCYLLRTSLAKSEKDRLRAAATSIEEIKDVSKLEKHLIQVFDRVMKIESEQQPSKDSSTDEENLEEKEPEVPEIQSKPIGSQFGEASSRLLSARKSLLRRRHKNNETKNN